MIDIKRSDACTSLKRKETTSKLYKNTINVKKARISPRLLL